VLTDHAGDDTAAAIDGDAEHEVGRARDLERLRVASWARSTVSRSTTRHDAARAGIPRHALGMVEAVDEHRAAAGPRQVLQRVGGHGRSGM
jgi:hypothetical protein